uniref:Trichohyalin, putative n=1 Tax=Brugia malayi TaxID=6279 RepID=A8PUU0_BRUMA
MKYKKSVYVFRFLLTYKGRKFEREKEQALEKLRQEHQKEIQLLEQRFSESQLLNLEQKYMIEIQRLEEERKSLKAEKERLGETFEMKLRRAQSLYETELTAAKMLYSKELEALRDHEEALKEELLARYHLHLSVEFWL